MQYIIDTIKIDNGVRNISTQVLESKIPLLSFAFRKAEEKVRNESSERFFIIAKRKVKKGDYKIIYDGSKNFEKE